MADVPNITLNNGQLMPAFGLGTWKSQPGEVSQAVKDAIAAGYRHIDCAHVYQNESEVGAGISAKIDDGTVSREDLFVVSKLWNTFHRPDLVEVGIRQTLGNLGLDYLDLYLIHFPHGWKEEGDTHPTDENGKTLYSDVDYLDTWKAMESLVEKGLTKSIGVSNFNSQQLQRVLDNAIIPPVTNQIECHPYLNQKKLIDFCKSKNVTVTAYSPFGSPDRPWAEASDPKVLEDPILAVIGEKYDKSSAQVILRWLIQRELIVIPKSVTKSRIEQNLNIFDFELSSSDMEEIDSMDRNWRAVLLHHLKDHQHYPFNIEF